MVISILIISKLTTNHDTTYKDDIKYYCLINIIIFYPFTYLLKFDIDFDDYRYLFILLYFLCPTTHTYLYIYNGTTPIMYILCSYIYYIIDIAIYTEEGHRSVRKLWSFYYRFIGLKCHNYALCLCFVYE